MRAARPLLNASRQLAKRSMQQQKRFMSDEPAGGVSILPLKSNPTMEIGVAMVFGIGAGFGECQHPELGVQLRLNVLLFQLLHAFQELLKVHPYDDDYTFFVVVGQVGRWNPPSRSCVTWVAVSLQLCGGTPRGTSSRSRPTTRTTLEALNGDDCSDELAHSPRGVYHHSHPHIAGEKGPMRLCVLPPPPHS
eukprot:3213852-Rhodomonas_salina.1